MAPKPLLALITVALLGACNWTSHGDFRVNLTLKSAENSADNISQMETLELDGTHGEYTWVYEEEGLKEDFDREKTESFSLNEEEVESLKLFLKEQGLAQNLTEEKSMGELGDTVEMILEMEIDGKKTSIVLSGMSAIYGSGTGESNLENFGRVESAQDLIYTVKDLGGLYND